MVTHNGTTGVITGSGCVCDSNFYTAPKVLFAQELLKKNPVERNLCISCPVGAACSGQNLSLADLPALPGYWRSDVGSADFVKCADAFNTESQKESASNRCCNPLAGVTCTGNFIDPDVQCEAGYRGPLCMVCAKEHVRIDTECVQCPGGSKFEAALELVFGFAGLVFFVLTITMIKHSHTKRKRSKSKKQRDLKKRKVDHKKKHMHKTNKTKNAIKKSNSKVGTAIKGAAHADNPGMKKLFSIFSGAKNKEEDFDDLEAEDTDGKLDPHTKMDRINAMVAILVSWFQILNALTITYTIEWPTSFEVYSQSTGPLVNLEPMGIFSSTKETCQLALPFLMNFIITIISPLLLAFAVMFAWLVARCESNCCGPKHDKVAMKRHRYNQTTTMVNSMLLISQLMYPKIGQRSFQVLRCTDVPGVGTVLLADFSIHCHTGEHMVYLAMAYTSIVVYCIGVPAIVAIVLWRHRKHLHRRLVEARLGGLYKHYELKYYLWEPLMMLYKMALAGAMVAIAPGSSLQLLIALLVSCTFMLMVLKAAPFKGHQEDLLSFFTSLSLSCSLLLGFALVTDNKVEPTFNVEVVGVLLIMANTCPLVYFVWASVWIFCKGASIGLVHEEKRDGPSMNKIQQNPPVSLKMRRHGSLKYNMELAVLMKKAQENIDSYDATLKMLQDSLEAKKIKSMSRLKSRIQLRKRKLSHTDVKKWRNPQKK